MNRDSVEWDSDQELAAQGKINENSKVKLGDEQQGMFIVAQCPCTVS